MKLYWQDAGVQSKIINKLQKNEILITSTDTVPGLLANATKQGFDNLNQIKGGRQGKPYIILISDMAKLAYFADDCALTSEVQKILSSCWPGPLTVIFNSKPGMPDFLKSESDTVAMRCPSHFGLLSVLQNFDGLFSTSANKSCEVQPDLIDNIATELLSSVGLAVDDRDRCFSSEFSTILDFSCFDQDKKIYLLRQGAFALSKIEELADIKIYKK
ncbi:MAG: hypothetical protein US49_C0009G0021 [candidate division TM6 bacterium GW2011_GWF2_37_49]|nr:MAG: hypothetical protein US49_C0009G0021 [candidate division TM6 bacterium GW2011_GWF2_37_49]